MSPAMIYKTVNRLSRKFYTQDPFEIAQSLNIIILFESLKGIRGYYSSLKRIKFIHINQELDEYSQKFTCAHELGHAVLHPTSNTPFLRETILFSINKMETEANRFAISLLYMDDEVEELTKIYQYTTSQIVRLWGVPESLAEYRVNCLKFV